MEIDLLGKIREKKLSYNNTLLPLFEAIVNSIHAIEEDSVTNPGIIEVELIRSSQQELTYDNEDITYPITDFIITDNGIGFNEPNYESFNFAHSTYKLDKGGKGIGRITWLRAFERAKIESVYKTDTGLKKRSFSFERTKKGIEKHIISDLSDSELSRYTKVHLNDLKKEYQKWCNSKSEDIALKIIEHCFSYFLDDICPRIIIKDGISEMVVNDLFGLYTKQSVIKKPLKINGHDFQLDIVKLYSPKQDNKVHFRAHKREVYSKKLSDYIPEVQKHFTDENGELFSICVYISGDYLDEKVNEERTEIFFSRQSLFPDEITEDEITAGVINIVKEAFKSHIDEFSNHNIHRVKEFVKDHPRYRYLLKYKYDELKHISSTLPDSKLEIELFKVQQKLELEILAETEERLSNIAELNPDQLFDDELYNKITEVGSAKLAEYVLHRKKILELLDVQLKKSNEGKYSKEEAIHQLVFPLRMTSDELGLEEHNLWVIDERLAFHDYLASDTTFRSNSRTNSNSTKETDIVIFNKPHILNEGDKPYTSIIIIEFKRPMRDDYTDKENPINQINTYVRELLANKALDKNGRPFDLRKGTPIYAYIVCDLTPKMRQFADDQNFTVLPDNDGYFNFNKNYELYVEIISFDKLISDSKKRNKILFEKLNLPTS